MGDFAAKTCREMGCKASVPVQLIEYRMCVFHFSLFVEQECAEIRRETALGRSTHDRQLECIRQIAANGKTLVSVAMNGFPLPDEVKARILSTVLTLINCRESMDRASLRHPGPL